jgi:hypothetical protein
MASIVLDRRPIRHADIIRVAFVRLYGCERRIYDRVRLLGSGPTGERRARCLESLERYISAALSHSLDACRLPLVREHAY